MIDVAFVLAAAWWRDLSTAAERTNARSICSRGSGLFRHHTPEVSLHAQRHFQSTPGRVVTDDGYVVQSDGGAIALQPQAAHPGQARRPISIRHQSAHPCSCWQDASRLLQTSAC